MIGRNFVFVTMGLNYTIHFIMMGREPLRSSALYLGLMEAVPKVRIVVGPFDWIISNTCMVSLIGSDWYDVYQFSVCVGELLIRL